MRQSPRFAKTNSTANAGARFCESHAGTRTGLRDVVTLRERCHSVRIPGLRPFTRTRAQTVPAKGRQNPQAPDGAGSPTGRSPSGGIPKRARRTACPGDASASLLHPPALPGAWGAGAPKPSRTQEVGPHPFGARLRLRSAAASGPGLRPLLTPSSLQQPTAGPLVGGPNSRIHAGADAAVSMRGGWSGVLTG